MNWEMIAATGQMLGSVAVLVTIWYLAVQVRHARDEARRSIVQRRTDGVRENLMSIATDARLISIITKANAELGVPRAEFVRQMTQRTTLTEEEAVALNLYQWCSWQVYVPVVQSLQELTNDERSANENNIRRAFGANTIAGLWFDSTKQNLNTVIANRVERLRESSNRAD